MNYGIAFPLMISSGQRGTLLLQRFIDLARITGEKKEGSEWELFSRRVLNNPKQKIDFISKHELKVFLKLFVNQYRALKSSHTSSSLNYGKRSMISGHIAGRRRETELSQGRGVFSEYNYKTRDCLSQEDELNCKARSESGLPDGRFKAEINMKNNSKQNNIQIKIHSAREDCDSQSHGSGIAAEQSRATKRQSRGSMVVQPAAAEEFKMNSPCVKPPSPVKTTENSSKLNSTGPKQVTRSPDFKNTANTYQPAGLERTLDNTQQTRNAEDLPPGSSSRDHIKIDIKDLCGIATDRSQSVDSSEQNNKESPVHNAYNDDKDLSVDSEDNSQIFDDSDSRESQLIPEEPKKRIDLDNLKLKFDYDCDLSIHDEGCKEDLQNPIYSNNEPLQQKVGAELQAQPIAANNSHTLALSRLLVPRARRSPLEQSDSASSSKTPTLNTDFARPTESIEQQDSFIYYQNAKHQLPSKLLQKTKANNLQAVVASMVSSKSKNSHNKHPKVLVPSQRGPLQYNHLNIGANVPTKVNSKQQSVLHYPSREDSKDLFNLSLTKKDEPWYLKQAPPRLTSSSTDLVERPMPKHGMAKPTISLSRSHENNNNKGHKKQKGRSSREKRASQRKSVESSSDVRYPEVVVDTIVIPQLGHSKKEVGLTATSISSIELQDYSLVDKNIKKLAQAVGVKACSGANPCQDYLDRIIKENERLIDKITMRISGKISTLQSEAVSSAMRKVSLPNGGFTYAYDVNPKNISQGYSASSYLPRPPRAQDRVSRSVQQARSSKTVVKNNKTVDQPVHQKSASINKWLDRPSSTSVARQTEQPTASKGSMDAVKDVRSSCGRMNQKLHMRRALAKYLKQLN